MIAKFMTYSCVNTEAKIMNLIESIDLFAFPIGAWCTSVITFTYLKIELSSLCLFTYFVVAKFQSLSPL